MSLLLSKKDILILNTRLAVVIGLNEAVVLQQLAYWLEETNSGVEHAGVRWIYNTHEQWRDQFPFWSVDTVKRTFTALHKRGLVKVKQLSEDKRNQTNYYTVDYETVALLHQGKLPSWGVQVAPMDDGKLPSSLDRTKTTTKTTAKSASRFEDFWNAWPKGERKQDRKKCLEKWTAGKLDLVADAILADIAIKLNSEKWRGGYIESPLVYLNNRRWEDGTEATDAQTVGFI